MGEVRWPAEWDSHECTWMLWPHRPDNWRNRAEPAQEAFSRVAEAIARFEPVRVGVNPEHRQSAELALRWVARVVEIPSDDAWVRDTGPTVVYGEDGRRVGLNWEFNAWGGYNGGLYHPWNRDLEVASRICAWHDIPLIPVPMILEGGAIHGNGGNFLMMSEECVLNPNRNPGLSRKDTEYILRNYLNPWRIVWLKWGVYADETDGHIDNMACFVPDGRVLLTWTDDTDDPQYPRSRSAWELLRNLNFEVEKLPQPGPLFATQQECEGIVSSGTCLPREPGSRLAASYINHYVCNGGVIVPVFGVSSDENALKILEKAYPGREIVPVPGREILLGGGSVHCITQQIPAQPPAG